MTGRRRRLPRLGTGGRFALELRTVKGARNPRAVLAAEGRRKYGRARMARWAAAGRRRAARARGRGRR